jgi:Na+-transporting NADH:ubiquinone oxidoreductase subunit B
MKFLREKLDQIKKPFNKGEKFEKYAPAINALDTFLFVPNHTTKHGAHIRDAVDLKRTMMMVILALIPALIFGIWNAGYQSLSQLSTDAVPFMDAFIHGSWKVLPMIAVSYGVGLGIEFAFAIFRGHEVNEGYLVTGLLIPMIMPIDLPLWMLAISVIFAVLIGKEAFGGTGMNILNVAMTARAFLYFAYPAQISGDQVWTYLGEKAAVDGFSGATALAVAYNAGVDGVPVVDALATHNTVLGADLFSFSNLFMGWIPGSIGETSTLMALIGAAILIGTGVASWKIIVSGFAGAYLMGLLLNVLAVNEYMAMPPQYHWVMGGLAFGIVFMATDPVSAAQTETGKWIYGLLIGVFTVIIRVTNPAYPEGIMLAVLFMNVFAPLIDYYVVKANKTRRLQRATV